MQKHSLRTYFIWVIFTEAVGAASAWLTRGSMQVYQNEIIQPTLSPPGIVFPIVWTVLFALMGIGAARVYLAPPSAGRSRALAVYFLQLAFNFGWSIIFFNMQRFGFALLWLAALWLLILLMLRAFGRVDKCAARLQIPYLLWVSFAAYLNYGVWQLN